jgi:hypothetical protein
MSDQDLIRALHDRDGDVAEGPPSHLRSGRCKYAGLYPLGDCPWCAAGQTRAEDNPASARLLRAG